MMPNEDETDISEMIDAWLNKPEMHLGKKARREWLEGLITDRIAKERRDEKWRTHGKDLLLFCAAMTVAYPFLEPLLAYFGTTP